MMGITLGGLCRVPTRRELPGTVLFGFWFVVSSRTAGESWCCSRRTSAISSRVSSVSAL
jgi:hypothetical protein